MGSADSDGQDVNMKAWNLTRADMHYRHEVFSAGLRAAGYDVRSGAPEAKPGNLLLIWNRYGAYHDQASSFERGGGTVVVAENGYLGKDADGNQFYALARGGHNGSGQWYVGGPERFAALGIELKPWRTDGNHILVCGQRGIGSPTMASPPNWHEGAAERLRKQTKRPIKIRTHPGNKEAAVPLSADLAGAWACAIWSSSSGIQALVAGIPVLFDAPHWVCAPAGGTLASVESPPMDDAARLTAMQRMAWGQWTLDDITSGEPFRRLLA
jgi:hypothetical protein